MQETAPQPNTYTFHPAVDQWFRQRFGQPSKAQERGWPAIQAGSHTLIAAPTGSGKTLAAFLAVLDNLFRRAAEGQLGPGTRVLYVSPLKALSNDIHRNLEEPLAALQETFAESGIHLAPITAAVRTGDTSPRERQQILKNPPHILVTTPESFYLLLTSEGGQRLLTTVETLIVDEIHALVANRRGAHLALSIERLDHITQGKLQRIGLSATQRPMDAVARFLVGAHQIDPSGNPQCTVIDEGHLRQLDLDLDIPDSPLEAVMSNECWEEVYRHLVEAIQAHRTTLIFTNTRRMAERITLHLANRLGEDAVTSHHGSLSLKNRTRTERGLKDGSLRAVVATASLELGIDIGHVDLVCQLGSPRAVSTFLQRIGRSGHYHGGIPKGRLFPLTRDELAECTALIHCVRQGQLDVLQFQARPLDVLCQQIVAAVACQDWQVDALYSLIRNAWLYRDLERPLFDSLIQMLADGYDTKRGRRAAHIYYDGVQGMLKPRKGARLTALTNGGAIPDNGDYTVIQQPAGTFIGTVHEDFAVESIPGDVFQLGNHSWRVQRVELGRVLVEDAEGQPPTIPFWLGEAPARSDALSRALADLRDAVDTALQEGERAQDFLIQHYAMSLPAAQQLGLYLEATRLTLGRLPSQNHLVIERFFDEAGGMQMVIHSPFGARLNRAWGLALRKRFCRSFNFELQAAASDDAIVISLGPKHAFPLEDVYQFLHPNTVRDILIQALLDAPIFKTRWRWNATRALAMVRFRGGKRVPATFQRMDAEDLIAIIFPDQLACLENIAGDREVPDHPLVQQTLDDCLEEYLDLPGLTRLLQAIAANEVSTLAVDLPQPSPLAHEILTAKPYAFLDDAPLEERRTQAVYLRRGLDLANLHGAGFLDPDAIALVREQAWPDGTAEDEVHEALQLLGALPASDCPPAWLEPIRQLKAQLRVGSFQWHQPDRTIHLLIAAESLPRWQALRPDGQCEPQLIPPERDRLVLWDEESARLAVVRRRLEVCGPTTVHLIAQLFGLAEDEVNQTFHALEGEGVLMRGSFDQTLAEQEPNALQWCDRRLLARIRQLTLARLRAQIKPVSPQAFMRFLFTWQSVTPEAKKRGVDGLMAVIEQLEGYEAAAGCWEPFLLATRVKDYQGEWLDQLCLSGQVSWSRLSTSKQKRPTLGGPIKSTPLAFYLRENSDVWCADLSAAEAPAGYAGQVLAVLETKGALFFNQLVEATRLLPSQVEQGLAELVAIGRISADCFAGLRALILPAARKPRLDNRFRRRFSTTPDVRAAGRWSAIATSIPPEEDPDLWAEDVLEYRARVLLRRYGVVFRRLLEREPAAPRWRELLDVYRRLEARGEVRGGRFVDGFSGEQFALSEAVSLLRKHREPSPQPASLVIHAADPLNLTSILLNNEPGVSRLPHQKVLFWDGLPVAAFERDEVRHLATVEGLSPREIEFLLRTERRNQTLLPS